MLWIWPDFTYIPQIFALFCLTIAITFVHSLLHPYVFVCGKKSRHCWNKKDAWAWKIPKLTSDSCAFPFHQLFQTQNMLSVEQWPCLGKPFSDHSLASLIVSSGTGNFILKTRKFPGWDWKQLLWLSSFAVFWPDANITGGISRTQQIERGAFGRMMQRWNSSLIALYPLSRLRLMIGVRGPPHVLYCQVRTNVCVLAHPLSGQVMDRTSFQTDYSLRTLTCPSYYRCHKNSGLQDGFGTWRCTHRRKNMCEVLFPELGRWKPCVVEHGPLLPSF